jgi:hypothetical protein
MRLGFLINPDKSLHLFALTGDLIPASFVRVTWQDGVKPSASVMQSELWAMDECGVVLTTFARLVGALDESDRRNPLKVLEAIEAAKGKQVCLDAAKRLRCVATMRDDSTTYGASGVPELTVEVDSVDSEGKAISDDDTATLARGKLTKLAAAKLMEDGTSDDLAERLMLWKKAGREVKKLTDGKAPSYLDRSIVWPKR